MEHWNSTCTPFDCASYSMNRTQVDHKHLYCLANTVDAGGPLSSIVFRAIFVNASKDGTGSLTHPQFNAAVAAISREIKRDVGLMVTQIVQRASPERMKVGRDRISRNLWGHQCYL